MSCECAQCRQHYRTLGIAFGIPEESAIEEAYRESVKQWHPDLYENYASLRADAEEHFKQIQIAFRELKGHNAIGAESPAESVVVRSSSVVSSSWDAAPSKSFDAGQPVPLDPAPLKTYDSAPAISFDNAPGGLVASQFSEEVKELISRHIARTDTPLAIVDLNGPRSATFSHFFLLTNRGILVRDSRNTVSLLWYKDLGELAYSDRGGAGKSGFWQQISGGQSKRSLQIYRSDGNHFFSIPDAVDDNIKQALYNFLSRQKLQG
ncbi:MAG: J domain-containing protein [Terracidiphilus sp.]